MRPLVARDHGLRQPAIESGDADKANAEIRSTVSLVDKLAGKGIIHANTASRYKSRLARRLTGAGNETASASA